jgi:predicted metal-dependent hydrolase
MSTQPLPAEKHQIAVSGLTVSIDRKAIKNLHLGVYPPDGRVRVAAPLAVSDEAVRLAVIGKLGWIRRQQARFDSQPRQSQREMVSGESHYFLGRRYRLHVIPSNGAARVVLPNTRTMELHVRGETNAAQREQVLQRWYRHQLQELVPPILEKWKRLLGVEASDWRIRKMKTKWGTCHQQSRRITLNLELVKKPLPCLEYIIAHELVHLIERKHNDRFVAILNRHLPQWQRLRQVLNATPLANENWP